MKVAIMFVVLLAVGVGVVALGGYRFDTFGAGEAFAFGCIIAAAGIAASTFRADGGRNG